MVTATCKLQPQTSQTNCVQIRTNQKKVVNKMKKFQMAWLYTLHVQKQACTCWVEMGAGGGGGGGGGGGFFLTCDDF